MALMMRFSEPSLTLLSGPTFLGRSLAGANIHRMFVMSRLALPQVS